MSSPRSKNEDIKEASRLLRGTIADGLADPITGAIAEDDAQLTKFHGTYLQDDRDLRPERRKKKLEQAYSFMVRVRVPGGVVTPTQWLALDRIASDYANGTLRLTTRQAFQFHGVIKSNLKRTMQAIDASLLDTIAACGDVNRNVMCNPNPHQSKAHAAALELARAISDHLTPRTGAYHEIWLDGEKVIDSQGAEETPRPSGGKVAAQDARSGSRKPVGQDARSGSRKAVAHQEEEPIYGPTYLPRKFKTVVAVPPANDVDVFAQDLGFIAITDEAGEVVGYDVTVGGGMGMTHGEPETYPRTADVMGFCRPEQAVDVAEKVVTVQRDFGDRANRKHARLKYTIEDRGLDWFRAEVERRLGYALEPARPFRFDHSGDRYGWVKDHTGHWHYTLFIENGRVRDLPDHPTRRGLRAIAEVHQGDFRLTANQNLIIAGVAPRQKGRITRLLRQYGLEGEVSGLRRNAMACVALPTCALALAESERYLPELVDALDEVLERVGLGQDDIVIRMTGCPNGCARPYLAEIGLVGRTPGKYHLYLGAAFDGSRLNKLYRRDVGHAEIVAALTPLLERYAKERETGERFGNFVVRQGIIAATTSGTDFHANLPPDLAAA